MRGWEVETGKNNNLYNNKDNHKYYYYEPLQVCSVQSMPHTSTIKPGYRSPTSTLQHSLGVPKYVKPIFPNALQSFSFYNT